MKEDTTEEERAAFHEAGHAVANLVYGLPFETISLSREKNVAPQFADGKKAGVLTYTIGITIPEERFDSINKKMMAGVLDVKEAMTWLAGPFTEYGVVGEFYDQAEGEMWQREEFRAITGCCRAAMNGGSDPEKWEGFAEMERELVAAIAAGAQHLIKENWASIQAVAHRLIEKRELDYAEAAQIAEANGLTRRV